MKETWSLGQHENGSTRQLNEYVRTHVASERTHVASEGRGSFSQEPLHDCRWNMLSQTARTGLQEIDIFAKCYMKSSFSNQKSRSKPFMEDGSKKFSNSWTFNL